MKKIVVVALILAAFAVFGIVAFYDRDHGPQFKTEKVSRGTVTATVIATGTVNPVTSVQVGTQVSGTIKQIYVDYNSPVRKGQKIAQIDPAPFEAQVEQARATLLESQAGVEEAEAQLVDSSRNLQRQQELYSKNLIISKSELDDAETKYEVAHAKLELAKATLARSEAALKYAETNLQYTSIVSPVDGVVVERNVDVGQTVAASFQTPKLFTIAEDLTKMQIDTNVDEADIGNVHVGQDVEFTVDAYPSITFKGKVSKVHIAPLILENVVTYDSVVEVENPEKKLMPGMTANVSITVGKAKDVLLIPNAALRFFPADAGSPSDYKGAGVWVLRQDKPQRIQVETGISDGRFTQLISGDVREGDEVIVQTVAEEASKPSGPRIF